MHQGACGEHEDRRVRNAKALGSKHGAKVRLVRHDEVWPPLPGESPEVCGAGPGPAREALAQIPLLAGYIHLLQGQAPSRVTRSRRADSEGREACSLNDGNARRTTCHGRGVAGGLGCLDDRHHGVKMSGSTRKAEQDAHQPTLGQLITVE